MNLIKNKLVIDFLPKWHLLCRICAEREQRGVLLKVQKKPQFYEGWAELDLLWNIYFYAIKKNCVPVAVIN